MSPFELMKNLKNIEGKMQDMKAELATIRATGSSGGNMVQITLNGQFELIDIKLDPICVDNRDVPMLQDLIKAAHHSAIEKITEEIKQKSSSLMGINIPGL